MPRSHLENSLLVGLDLGSYSIKVLIGHITSSGHINIVGHGQAPAKGLRRGTVINLEDTAEAIQTAIQAAEKKAQCRVHAVYANFNGLHAKSIHSCGMTLITEDEIDNASIARVLETAHAIALQADQKVMHRLPQEFQVDHQEGVLNPLGMSGLRLEAKVHIITGYLTIAENIVKCVRRSGFEIDELILNALAIGSACLTQDEQQLGVCAIDIGASTTTIAVYRNGSLASTWSLPIAGERITQDIAIAFRIPTQTAELLKVRDAQAMRQAAQDKKLVIPSLAVQEQRFTHKDLANVVEARLEELFTLVQQHLEQEQLLKSLSAGFVLTGASTKMQHILTLAERVFKLPVRIGTPLDFTGPDFLTDPSYATGVGIIRAGYQQQLEKNQTFSAQQSWIGKLHKWLQRNL